MKRSLPVAIPVLAALCGCGADRGEGPDRPPATGTSGTVVVQSGVRTCEQPSARDAQRFDRSVLGSEWVKPPGYRTPDWDIGIGGRGLGVGDFDGDGLEDLLVPGHHQSSHLFLGSADGLVESAEAFGASDPTGFQGVSVADLDGDGDLDAMLYAIDRTPALLINDGDGRFEVRERPDWDDDASYPCGGTASFADYDRDGVLDLFYGRLGVMDRDSQSFEVCDSFLFHGVGGGEFEQDAQVLPAPLQSIRVLASGWHDFDDDGWPDLYAVADCAPAPQPNQLLWNREGLLESGEAAGMNVRLAGMGLAVGDLNEDGLLDAVVPGIDEFAALYSHPELGSWVDAAKAVGLQMRIAQDQRVGWGLELADLDNDGFLDLPAVFGRDRATLNMPWFEPDGIFHNLGDGTFEEVGRDWGFDEDTVERGLVVADLNHDGWLDLVSREVGGLVYVNTARCGQASWLELRLHDTTGNSFAIGAKITVEAGGRSLSRTVSAGSTSYSSGGPPQVHFGLGDAAVVDAIEVRWPDGAVERFEAIDARQVVDLWR